jgi:hypothetical protein
MRAHDVQGFGHDISSGVRIRLRWGHIAEIQIPARAAPGYFMR